jgi:hypothetical protein
MASSFAEELFRAHLAANPDSRARIAYGFRSQGMSLRVIGRRLQISFDEVRNLLATGAALYKRERRHGR